MDKVPTRASGFRNIKVGSESKSQCKTLISKAAGTLVVRLVPHFVPLGVLALSNVTELDRESSVASWCQTPYGANFHRVDGGCIGVGAVPGSIHGQNILIVFAPRLRSRSEGIRRRVS